MGCTFDQIIAYATFPSREWTEEDLSADFSLKSCFPWPMISFDEWKGIAKSTARSSAQAHGLLVFLLPLTVLVLRTISNLRLFSSYRANPRWFYLPLLLSFLAESLYDVIFFYNFFSDIPIAFQVGFYMQRVILFFNLFLDVGVSVLTFSRLIRHYAPGLAPWKILGLYLCVMGCARYLTYLPIDRKKFGRLDLDDMNRDRLQSLRDFTSYSFICQYSGVVFFCLCLGGKVIGSYTREKDNRRKKSSSFEVVAINMFLYFLITVLAFRFELVNIRAELILVNGDVFHMSKVGMGFCTPLGQWFTSVVSLMYKNLNFYFFHLIGFMLKSEVRRFVCEFDIDRVWDGVEDEEEVGV